MRNYVEFDWFFEFFSQNFQGINRLLPIQIISERSIVKMHCNKLVLFLKRLARLQNGT